MLSPGTEKERVVEFRLREIRHGDRQQKENGSYENRDFSI